MAIFWKKLWTASGDGIENDYILFGGYCLLSLFYICMLEAFNFLGRPVTRVGAQGRTLGESCKAAEADQVRLLDALFPYPVGNALDKGLLDENDGYGDGTDKEHSISVPLLPHLRKFQGERTATVIVSFPNNLSAMGKMYDSIAKIAHATLAEDDSGDVNGVSSFASSSMLQANVELNRDTLNQLKSVLVEDKTCTLQIGSWGILMQSEVMVESTPVLKSELVKLRVKDVPTVFHAEYAAGLLTVTGQNLEGAEIFVSNSTETIKLDVWRFLKLNTIQTRSFSNIAEEVLSLRIWLRGDVKKFSVLATKKVRDIGPDGQSVLLWSKAVEVRDGLWEVVLRLWCPVVILWVTLIKALISLTYLTIHNQALNDIFQSTIWIPLTSGGTAPPIFIYILLKLLPNRVVEYIKHRGETLFGGVCRGLLCIYYGFLNQGEPRFGKI